MNISFLINMKMPTVVGISILISRNFVYAQFYNLGALKGHIPEHNTSCAPNKAKMAQNIAK